MSYALAVEPEVHQFIQAQPEPLRSFIYASLDRLAASPGTVRSRSKRVAAGQLAEFRFDHEPGVSLWVTVEFRYGSDEQTLHIGRVFVEFGA